MKYYYVVNSLSSTCFVSLNMFFFFDKNHISQFLKKKTE